MTPRIGLASWNVESVRSHLDQVIGWIDAHEPDIVCLQETRAGAAKFPFSPFRHRGYDVIVHGGDDGRGGVALASRLSLSDVQRGIPGAVPPLDEPRSISATVAGLRLHTVYAPNGRRVATPAHRLKLAWFALLAAWLEIDRTAGRDGAAPREQILIGDLNIAPCDVDVWDASRYRRRNLTSEAERAAFAELLDGGQLVDVVRRRLGDEAAFTWWNRRSDFYETDRGWRLDHVLATPTADSRIASVSIDRAERGRPGSADHAPLLVTLVAGPARPDEATRS